MHEVHFRIGGVKRPAVNATPGRAADNHGRRRIPEIVPFGDEIGELVEAAGNEVDELHLADGAQAKIAHAAGRSDYGAFADGRVDDALPTEALQQSFTGLEGAAVDADILANDHDGGVAL